MSGVISRDGLPEARFPSPQLGKLRAFASGLDADLAERPRRGPEGYPARLAELVQGRWSVEALQHVRDVAFAEDPSKIRTASAPRAMDTLRDLTIGLIRQVGWTDVVAAVDLYRSHLKHALDLLDSAA